MALKAPKKLLTFPSYTIAPLVLEKRFWNLAEVVKYLFWEKVKQNRAEPDLHSSCHLVLFEEISWAEYMVPHGSQGRQGF